MEDYFLQRMNTEHLQEKKLTGKQVVCIPQEQMVIFYNV